MSTNILRKYAAIFAFRYLCLLPNRQFFISTRWHVVLFLALSLASFPSQNLVSYFQSSISYFLKVMYSFFFTNNNWTNSFSNVWYQWDASRPCVRSRPCPPSPKKAIRFGPSKICLVLLQSSPQESKFLLCKATRQKTRPGCFCAKDCLDSIEMYTYMVVYFHLHWWWSAVADFNVL